MSQISYISIKDIINEDRMEAEFFCMASKLTSNFIYGKDIIKKVQYGTSDSLNEEKIGYPILRLNEFDGLFIGEPSKYCDLINEKQYKEIQLKKGDVLICRTNGSKEFVGRSAIVMEDQEMGFASYLFRLQPNEKINSETLLVYLNTIPGKQEILKYKMVSNQANFSPAKFNKIKIPNINTDIQQEVSEIVQTAYNKKQKSKQLYQEAEDLLLTELGLKNHIISHTLTFSTTKKAVDEAGRYDADYFQPKYDELIEKIENYKGGWDYVENLFKQNLSVAKINSETCNYVEIGDINISNGEIIPNEIFVSDLPANGKRVLKKNDLLISKVRPYRGAVSFIDFECENLIGSGAFTILQEKTDYKKEVLMVFLKTECIKDLLLRYNCGTSYPVIKDETILKLKLPLINPQLQKEISDKIKESFKLRNESKELLEQAKKMVEDEIEKE